MNFRFTLDNSIEGEYVLTKTPVGWDDIELSIKRSDLFKGLFFDFTTKLKFFCGGGGKEYLDNIYNTYGPEADVSILVEIDCSDSGTFDTLLEGSINFEHYEKTETSPEYTLVNIENAGIEQTVIKRYETTVNLNKLETIDGIELTDFDYGPYELNLHSKEIILSSLIVKDTEGYIPTTFNIFGTAAFLAWYVAPPFTLITYDDISGTELTLNDYAYNVIIFPVIPLTPIFTNNGDTANFTIVNQYTGVFRNISTNPTPDDYVLDYKYKVGTVYTTAPEVVIQSFGTQVTTGNGDVCDVGVEVSDSRTITIPAGESLWVYFDASGFTVDTGESNTFTLFATTASLKISEITTAPESICKAFAVYEAGARIAQSITNSTDAFRSDFFGRVDAQPYAVEENGCGAFTAITNGYQIRSFPIEDSGASPILQQGRPIYNSLKTYFESLSAIHNLGLGVEDGQYIRIEPIEYFFSTEVLFQIPNIKGIKVRNADEFYISNMEVGYDKWETEEVNGLDEVNTKREYSTKLKKTGNPVSKLSRYVASPYALELTRRKQYTDSSTEDSKYDQENFIICLNRSVNPYTEIPSSLDVAEKDENFGTVTNLISPETTYNLRITPGRIIRNWFKSIAPSVLKMNDTLKAVKFAFGQGNYKMVSTCTDACDAASQLEVDESEDLEVLIPASDSKNDPLFENEFIVFEQPLSYTKYQLIKANPYKCLEISTDSSNFIKAFIFDVRYNVVKGKAKFILLKAYQPATDCTHIYVEAGYVECGYVA